MKSKIGFILIVLALGMAACFDDDSTLGTHTIGDIKIGELRDTTIVSFMGNVLALAPEVVTDYDEATLEYAWYLVDNAENTVDNGYRANQIAETKELSYEVNLASGDYTVIFEVTATENNYTQTASMSLHTATSFSEGYYILKETADGNTDVDVYGINGLSEDVISGLYGEAVQGRPTNIAVTYNQSYIDEETQEMASTNMVSVFTDANKYRGFRTEDMARIFDETTIRFDGLEDGEVPYTSVRATAMNFLLTSEGVYAVNIRDVEPSSGKVGLPATGGSGASKYIIPNSDYYENFYYWNNEAHSLYVTDANALSVMPVDYDKGNVNEANLICLACGFNGNGVDETTGFVLEDQTTGERYLYFEANLGGINIRKLDSDLHISHGEIVAFNGVSGTYIYSVDNNQVFAYNWNEDTEISVSLPDLPSSETITYLSNQYWQEGLFGDPSNNFDDLVIVTQNGNDYKIYLYKTLIGGVPERNQAPEIIEGTGKVKSVRFASSKQIGSFGIFLIGGEPMMFPYGD